MPKPINIIYTTIHKLFTTLPVLHKRLLVLLFAFCLLLIFFPSSVSTPSDNNIPLPDLVDSEYVPPEEQVEIEDIPDYEWTVDTGDTLSETFSMLGLSKTMTALQEADKNVLSLDIIKKGDKYRFWLGETQDDYGNGGRQLDRLEQVLGVEHQVVFQRKGEGFEYKETIIEGTWRQNVISGVIRNRSSFYQSAIPLGVTANDVEVIKRLMKSKINFSRKIDPGDKFQIIQSHQYVGDVSTGNTRVEAVRFFNRKRVYSVFSFKDNYYDEKGDGLERAFARYPVNKKYRISSSFNPKRRHPVTRLIRPHNGTDFAVPRGTPIYAPGDGVVKRVVRHKYAGLYIEIQHNYKYKTRYLHLSKALVKKGQTIKKGDRIALSGNSGRSTGPHLHYEFHVNQRPINAMGKKVPIAIGVDKKSLGDYNRQVSDMIKQMESKKPDVALDG